MLGDSRMLTSRRLEFDLPPLSRRIIVCRLNLCRVQNFEVEGLYVSYNLRRKVAAGKEIRCLEFLVITWSDWSQYVLFRADDLRITYA